ncbi:hypothetical protein WG899_19075 [Paucibacter sp. AS339]|uniref:hypothetical protein n=1 Tax=Paucibacter hankyongi TaxID=3133434 RepID=UPI0030980B65
MANTDELLLYPLERDVTAAAQALNERADWQARLYAAWGLRQLNSPRAQSLAAALLRELAQETEQSTDTPPIPAANLHPLRARLQLVQAEVAMLMLRLDEAQQHLDLARPDLDAQPEPAVLADWYWLQSCVYFDRGEVDAQRDALQSALDIAEQADDAERQLFFRATLARSDLFRDFELARATWSEQLPLTGEGLSPQCQAAVADYRALEQGLANDYVDACHSLEQAYEASLASGQLRRAIAAASNLGYSYTSMSDVDTALVWLKKGLALARKMRWPGAIGLCLAQTGEALRRVGQTESARELLRECMQTLVLHPKSRTAMMALDYLGQAELDHGHYDEALKHFELLGEREKQASASDMRTGVALGQARALMHLGRLDAARQVALDACKGAAAQKQRADLVELHALLAEIEKRGAGSAEAVLSWLNQALALSQTIEGYQPAASLLEAAAEAQFQAGRPQEAYAMERRASAARQTSWSTATKHARQQAELARNERLQARQLALSKEERLNKLQAAHEQLQQLVVLGREIWRQHSPSLIFTVLARELKSTVKAELLAAYQPAASSQQLALAPWTKAVPEGLLPTLAMNDPAHPCAACWRDWAERSQALDSGATRIFAPLVDDEANLGVLVLELAAGLPWGKDEQAVLRHLGIDAAMSLKRCLAVG